MKPAAKLWQLLLAAAPSRQRWLLSALRRRRKLRELPSLLRGYYPEVEALYGGDPGDYLDERSRETLTGKLNGGASVFLNDKLVFQLVMPAEVVPELLGVVIDGRMTKANGRLLVASELFAQAGHAVVRPIDGRKGRGLLFVERSETGFAVNGHHVTTDALTATVENLRYHIITRYVEQHPYARRVFPGAVNTMRLLMMRDPADGTPFLAAALHRFGTARSTPVDNWSSGGISVRVDLDSGRLGRGVINPAGAELEWLSHHPQTGAQIEGELIPRWEQLKGRMIDTMRAMPMIRYVGWDVVQTSDGPQIIEGNNLPDLRGTQVHGGILRDARVARFYEHYGVLCRQRQHRSRR